MSKNYINPSLIAEHETIIVGLSGGPDSIFLLHQLVNLSKEKSFRIIAAHLNHEWRENAVDDVIFCKKACENLDVSFITKKISELTIPQLNIRSLEAQGRYYRKHFLESLLNEYSAHKIFIGHHKDDQLETFFIKLIRGTSIEGLGCMKEVSGNYYRPLLAVSKKTILEYLQEHTIAYLHDSTNDDTTFLRNNIRHNLIPLLNTIDSRASNNILTAIDDIQETNTFLDEQVTRSYAITVVNNVFNMQVFQQYSLFIQKKILLHWLYTNECTFTTSSSFIDEIMRFITSPRGGTHQLTSSWKLIKKEGKVTIEKK